MTTYIEQLSTHISSLTVFKSARKNFLSQSRKFCTILSSTQYGFRKNVLTSLALYQYIFGMQQESCNEVYENKFHYIKPIIGNTGTIQRSVCLGKYMYFTHVFFLKDEDPSISCQCINTVKHFMLKCRSFNQTQKGYFQKP